MRHVHQAIDKAQALARLSGPNRSAVRRAWLRLFPFPPPLKLEVVWLPAYLVTIALERSIGPDRVTCSVEGFSGSFAIFEMPAAVRDGEPEGESFPPQISVTQAEEIAREGLVTTLLRRSGQARRVRPASTQSIELLLWPYWVYYHRGRRGRMDIQLLDAATGSRPGLKIKLGLLDSFRQKLRDRDNSGAGDHT